MEKEKITEVCQKIKAYLKYEGITINAAAERLESTPRAVSAQLAGRPFSRTTAEKYASVFGFSETYLMTGEGQLVAGEPAEGDAPQASAQEKVERLLATIESQQRTIEILARKLG